MIRTLLKSFMSVLDFLLHKYTMRCFFDRHDVTKRLHLALKFKNKSEVLRNQTD